MAFHRALGKHERARCLTVGQRLSDEPGDLALAGGERVLRACPGGGIGEEGVRGARQAGHVQAAGVRGCAWRLLDASGWPDNQSCRNLLAWSWGGDGTGRHVVVINLSGDPAQGRVPLPWADLPGRNLRLADLLAGNVFERDGSELASPGLFVALGPWQCHLLAVPDSPLSTLS